MYTKFYNFSARPFALTPDLKFLFKSDSHKRALSYLHYGLDQAEGFVVITGQIGAGKTILIQALLEDLKTQEIATARVAAANLTKEEIIPMVASALKQPYEGKSKTALIRDLELSLRRAREYLKGVLLIIDEAQTLTPDALEELRILSNLESNGKALLQIFLIGQSDFRNTLFLPEMEPLRQRIVASYNLDPLTRAELKRYIGFRLLAVGWEAKPSISNEVYDIVHQFTGGIPRKVNIFMDRFFVYGYLEELNKFTGQHAEDVAKELAQELAGDFLKHSVIEKDEIAHSISKRDGQNIYSADDSTTSKLQNKKKKKNNKNKNKSNNDKKNGSTTKKAVKKTFGPTWEVESVEDDENPGADELFDAPSGAYRTPLENRLRGLDKKLKKLSDKARSKR